MRHQKFTGIGKAALTGLAIVAFLITACAPSPSPTAAPPAAPTQPAAPAAAPTTPPVAPPTTVPVAQTAAPKPAATAASAGSPATTGQAKPGAKPLEKVSLRLGFRWAGHRAAHFLAKAKGFFADEGLDVEISEGTGAMPGGQLVGANKETFGEVTPEALFKLIEGGAPIKSIFLEYQKSSAAYTLRRDANIKTPKDFEGKTVAVTPGSVGGFMLPTFLKINNVDASKVNVVQLDFAAKPQAFLAGRAQVIETFINDDHLAVGKIVPADAFLLYDYKLPTVGQTVVTSMDVIRERPQVIRSFNRAFRKALDYTKERPEEAVDLLVKGVPTIQRDVALEQLKATYNLMENDVTKQNGFGYSDPSSWVKSQEVLSEAGYLEKGKTKADQAFTNEFLK